MLHTIYGRGGHVGFFGHLNSFSFSQPLEALYEIYNLAITGPVVSEEKLFEIVDGRWTTTDDGACLYYNSLGAD